MHKVKKNGKTNKQTKKTYKKAWIFLRY